MELIREQSLASDPTSSVWVTANAGTGKTKVLSDRVLRLLLDGIAPNKILCLTFTNAAAAEMSERIGKELSRWILASDNELNSTIKLLTGMSPDKDKITLAKSLFTEVIDNPGSLKIQTIHSFCTSLLKRFPLEACVVPHFKGTDEETSRELLSEAWIRLLSNLNSNDEKYNVVRDSVKFLSRNINISTMQKAMYEVIKERKKFEKLLAHFKGYEGLVTEVYRKLGATKGLSENEIITAACSDNLFDKTGIQKLYEVLSNGSKTEVKRSEKIALWLSFAEEKREENFYNYLYVFLKKTDGSAKKISAVATKKSLNFSPELEEIIAIEQERLLHIHEEIKSYCTAALTECLIHITEAVLKLYERIKSGRAILDYDDLIMKTWTLLEKSENAPWVMYKLDGGIDHILLDEAQDTSPEQWDIIASLCREFFAGKSKNENNRTLFVVGDEKQSIFSFQGADPAVFNKMHNLFSETIKQARKSWRYIPLELSFRSTEPILKLVDTIFSEEKMRHAITAVEPNIHHEHFRKGEAGLVEIWPLVSLEKDEEDTSPWTLPLVKKTTENTKAILADNIALTIKNWLEKGRILKSKNRPIVPADIMVLIRRRDDFAELLIKALQKYLVPVAGIDRLELKNHIAVMDLISLGKFLLLPEDNLSLAEILKSPLIGLSEEELFDLAYNRGSVTLWKNLSKKHNENENFTKAFSYLSALLSKVDFLTPFELYSHILDATDGRKLFISRLGKEVNDPLDEFINLAKNYPYRNVPSLQGFLHQILSSSTMIKRDMEKNNRDFIGEIRIMTIHGAKGLQAPIVFLPDTVQTPKAKANLFFDEEGFFFWSRKKENRNRLCQELAAAENDLRHDEYLRLLYVALTRAEDELYICGAEGSTKISENSWYKIAEKAMLELTDNGQPEIDEEKQAVSYSGSTRGSNEDCFLPFKDPQVKPEENTIYEEDQRLPDFATNPPPLEENTTLTIAPSHLMGAENIASPLESKTSFNRGKLIHLLLQILPNIPDTARENVAKSIINKENIDLSSEAKNNLIDEVLSLLSHDAFAKFFGKNSQAEVEVSGKINGNIISGQIDRLVILEDEIWIIDYKSDANPPISALDIPKRYIKQMEAYRSLLQDIYSDKKISSALIWTEIPRLDRIQLGDINCLED